MTQTQFVAWRGRGFWAYDVALSVLLKHVVDQAEAYGQRAHAPWLAAAIEEWRTVACLSDFGLNLDSTVIVQHRELVGQLFRAAIEELGQRSTIPAHEVASWQILGDAGTQPRGEVQIDAAPIIELGDAILALMNDVLPDPPPGTFWLYGTSEGRSTIRRRESKA